MNCLLNFVLLSQDLPYLRAIEECVKILQDRAANPHESCPACHAAATKEGSIPQSAIAKDLTTLSHVDLVNLLLHMQEERIKTFHSYNKGLEELIAKQDVSSYPLFCAENTAIFQAISNTAIAIKNAAQERGLTRLYNLISEIQLQERDKLTIVAAQHLDAMQQAFPQLQSHLNTHPADSYNSEQLESIENKIATLVEKVQDEKIEIIENSLN